MKIELTPEEVEGILDHLAFSYTAAQQDAGTLSYYGQDENSPAGQRAQLVKQQALALSKKLYAILEGNK